MRAAVVSLVAPTLRRDPALAFFGAPRAEVYYDPRTAVPGPPCASLHAKCVLVDDARALIASANLTDRRQTRNIEGGVLIEDEAWARELAGQWRGLVAAGVVRRARA